MWIIKNSDKLLFDVAIKPSGKISDCVETWTKSVCCLLWNTEKILHPLWHYNAKDSVNYSYSNTKTKCNGKRKICKNMEHFENGGEWQL